MNVVGWGWGLCAGEAQVANTHLDGMLRRQRDDAQAVRVLQHAHVVPFVLFRICRIAAHRAEEVKSSDAMVQCYVKVSNCVRPHVYVCAGNRLPKQARPIPARIANIRVACLRQVDRSGVVFNRLGLCAACCPTRKYCGGKQHPSCSRQKWVFVVLERRKKKGRENRYKKALHTFQVLLGKKVSLGHRLWRDQFDIYRVIQTV